LAWLSRAPFGLPVVPEVKKIQASSPGEPAGRGHRLGRRQCRVLVGAKDDDRHRRVRTFSR
jgi:hypothetical protein